MNWVKLTSVTGKKGAYNLDLVVSMEPFDDFTRLHYGLVEMRCSDVKETIAEIFDRTPPRPWPPSKCLAPLPSPT